MPSLRRIKRLRSYAEHARFLAEVCESPIAWLARCQVGIHEPYRSGPSHGVYHWRGRSVVILETGQRQFDVYEVPADMQRFQSDDEATAFYLRSLTHERGFECPATTATS